MLFRSDPLRIVIEETDGLSWPWAWYLRGVPGVVYASRAAVPNSVTPASMAILLPESMAAYPELVTGRQVIPYHHRWWFPEEGYKSTTPSSLVQGLLSGRLLADWVEFERHHIAPETLGSFDARLLYPVGVAPASGIPTGAGGGLGAGGR